MSFESKKTTYNHNTKENVKILMKFIKFLSKYTMNKYEAYLF